MLAWGGLASYTAALLALQGQRDGAALTLGHAALCGVASALLSGVTYRLESVAQSCTWLAMFAMYALLLDSLILAAILSTLDVLMIAAVAKAIVVKADVDRQRTETAQSDSERRARLTAVNAQTQSHFLFNSLNSISSVMHDSPERADKMIRRLAALIEIAFADDELEVELTRELELVRRYLAMHAASDDLRVLWSVGETTARARVPRLFLQPIIENSLKYGTAQFGRGAIVIRTLQRNGQLVVMVSNGVEPSWPWAFQASPRRDSGGIGLQIVRERLSALWGDRFDLQLKRDEPWGSTVTVTMPFETM